MILTSANGSGKSRFLKSIETYINELRSGKEDEQIIVNI